MGNLRAEHAILLCPQKLVINSPNIVDRSVGVVRLRAKRHRAFLCVRIGICQGRVDRWSDIVLLRRGAEKYIET
jgi:hypothetical protein